MKTINALAISCSGVLTICSSLALIHSSRRISIHELTNSVIVESELRSLGLVLITLASGVVFSECIRQVRLVRITQGRTQESTVKIRSILAWVSGLLVFNSVGSSTSPQQRSSVHGVPIDDLLSPTAAAAVLTHIIRRRRTQIENRYIPDILTIEESEALMRIAETSKRLSPSSVGQNEYIMTPDVQTVLAGVERKFQAPDHVVEAKESSPWLIEVKLFGYPAVVASNGNIAEFRKKRALELLTWLTLNRDRARRSAARTALWDLEVSDSSFSTVVSDLRRALRDAAGIDCNAEFLPTTYSDDLPLSPLVTTDADRLQVAHRRFQETQVLDDELREVLQGMRDIPLAGTAYSWADLDGTTTRLVMSALASTMDVARISIERGALDDAFVATSAGLRVFPGCEELLDLQRRGLQSLTRKM